MKIPAEFLPKSWEMPPSARVIEESASVVARDFDGETLNWLVALVEIPPHKLAPIFWMRPLDKRFDMGFVSSKNTNHELLTLSKNTEDFALRASLSTVWKNKEVSRLFLLNKDGELRRDGEAAYESLSVSSDGIGAWNQSGIGNVHRSTSLFEFGSPVSNEEFLRIPALEIWGKLNLSSNSDAVYARQFVQLSEKECRSLIFNNTRGTNEEFEKWLRTLLLLQDVWNEPALGEELCLQYSGPNHLSLFWDDDYSGEPASVGPELEADVAAVRNWFFSVNTEVAHYSCVKQWLKQNNPYFRISVHPPTAHEQLEAQLRWREWKRNHEKI